MVLRNKPTTIAMNSVCRSESS